MGLIDEEVKARVMAKMEGVVEKVLARKKCASEITLTEIEQAVQAAGEQVKQALTEELVKQVSSREPDVPGPRCASCGEEMHYKGLKPKHIITEVGEVEVQRAYYYCDTCRRGSFPPG